MTLLASRAPPWALVLLLLVAPSQRSTYRWGGSHAGWEHACGPRPLSVAGAPRLPPSASRSEDLDEVFGTATVIVGHEPGSDR